MASDPPTVFPPEVIYIGLQKTGSTFLRGYFYSHPQVRCTRHGKFFLGDEADVGARGADAVRAGYAAHFADDGGKPCRIDMYEALGMGYLLHGLPDWDASVFVQPGATLAEGPVESVPAGVAARIAAAVPDARILITVREQGAWIDSNYRHFFEQMPAVRNGLRDFLGTREGQLVLDAAMFDRLVAIYDGLFGRERVYVLPMELIERDEPRALARLCEFLGIACTPYRDEDRNYNRGRPLDALRAATRRPRSRLAAWWRPKAAAGTGEAADLDLLRAVYRASNTRLAARIGLDLRGLGYWC